MLNHLLLISCICIIVGSIFFFFYLNRFLAWLLGLLIRFLYWRQGASSIYVSIGAIHFSILTGRILVKDVHYHSSNQTIRIVKGMIQWRYWIRRPMDEDDLASSLGPDEKVSGHTRSCRICVSIQGLEWFIYNRTAAYDNIVAQMQAHNEMPWATNSRRTSLRKTLRTPVSAPSAFGVSRRRHTLDTVQKALSWLRHQLPNLDPKDLLPLEVEVSKGAIVIGNASTPNLLVAEFKKTSGTYGVVPSRSKCDYYKNLLNLSFRDATISYKENVDYKDSMTYTGETLQERLEQQSHWYSYVTHSGFTKFWKQLGLYKLTQNHWQSNHMHHRPHIFRASTDGPPPDTDFTTYEYAVETKILEAPILDLRYYADVVGIVPEQPCEAASHSSDIGNGDPDPDWGIDLSVKRGVLRYGPWADRQRAELQRAFFPPAYFDAPAQPRLKPGDMRVWTDMRVFIELCEETTLHVPFREASKNWQWDGLSEDEPPAKKREAAWLHLTAADRSSIHYIMPMVATAHGYEPVLEVHLDTVSVTSSLNDIKVIQAETCRIRSELPSALKWNATRAWTFTITLRRTLLYLLRDHINLFTDLGKDWTSGPPSDFYRFIPMMYSIQIMLHHYVLNLNANDHNIVDKPLNKDENAIFTLRGAQITSSVVLPSDTFRAEATTVPFTVDIPEVSMNLSLPRWNTNALHLPKDGNSLVKIRKFVIDGSYRYFGAVRPENVEQLKLKLLGQDVTFKLLGWSIRYFMVLRDNYFGSFTHFSTLFEYLDRRRNGMPPGDPVLQKYREGKNNMLQVDLSVQVLNGLLVAPCGLFGYEQSCTDEDQEPGTDIGPCICLSFPQLQVTCRVHDYFMDLSVNIDPAVGRIEHRCPEEIDYDYRKTSPDLLVIDGIDVTANRLFGPLPKTITYICVWEVTLGHVKAILSAEEAALLAAAGNAFRINFPDVPNAPASEFVVQEFPDLTFVKLSVAAVNLTWRTKSAALVVSFDKGIHLDSNDLGGATFKKMTSLRMPSANAKVLLSAGSKWLEAGDLVADAEIDMYLSPVGWKTLAAEQAKFVADQDRVTRRAKRMISLLSSGKGIHIDTRVTHENGVYVPQPLLSSLEGAAMYMPLRKQPVVTTNQAYQKVTQYPPTFSDSDGEHGVSEAIRDARLAKMRATPVPNRRMYNVDGNMSSGDESDNEDLDKEDSTDSNFSDDESVSSEASLKPVLRRYQPYTRHYTQCRVTSPLCWAKKPFALVKDVATQPEEFDRNGFPCTKPLPPAPSEAISTTVVRLSSSRGARLSLNPLIMPALSYFEQDIKAKKLSLESFVDAMLVGYISKSSSNKAEQSCTIFDICLPFVRVDVLHDASPAPFDAQSSYQDNRDILSFQLYVQDVCARGYLQQEQTLINCSVQSVSLPMGVISATSRPALLALSVSNLNIDYRGDKVDVAWDRFQFDVGQSSPDYLASFLEAAEATLQELRSTTRRWREFEKETSVKAMSILLDSSLIEEDNFDPFSAIQPSYLVQMGRPFILRTDLTFRFLFHLRNHLWHARHSMQAFSALGSTRDGLKAATEARLRLLDPDAYIQSHLLELHALLPSLKLLSTSPKGHGVSLNCLALQAGSTAVWITDPSGDAPNVLEITSFRADSKTQLRQLLPDGQSNEQSQTSLPGANTASVHSILAALSIDAIEVAVYPHLMRFAQHILRARKALQPSSSKVKKSSPSPKVSSWINASLNIGHMRLRAVAETLALEAGLARTKWTSTLLQHRNTSSNHSLLIGDIWLAAVSPSRLPKGADHDLAKFVSRNVSCNVVTRQENAVALELKGVVDMDGLYLHVPRSAIRLYRFVEEWREDFLPGLEAALRELLTEAKAENVQPSLDMRPPKRRVSAAMQWRVQARCLGVYLQIMHGIWLTLEIHNILGYFHTSPSPSRATSQSFGLRTSSSVFCVISTDNIYDAASSDVKARVALPSLSVSGSFDGLRIRTFVLIDILKLKVKPSHWDTLLSVQQKFGQDFNDFIAIVSRNRRRSPPTEVKMPRNPVKTSTVIFARMKGFRVGLEGLSSTLYLECKDINGQLDSTFTERTWSLVLSDLALSLATGSLYIPSHPSSFNQSHRSAFVIIDFQVNSHGPATEDSLPTSSFQILLTRIHAVMQPSSIGELGDFVDHLQAEMLERKEQRAQDMAAFKEHTQSILKTFDVSAKETSLQEKTSFLSQYNIEIAISNVGIAFPLTHGSDLELPVAGNRDRSAVRAFLFSVKSIKFGIQRGETGQASLQRLSFQFVSKFRQSVSKDFAGDSHDTRNKLVYPEMTAQLRTSGSSSSRQIYMHASVSGFVVDLDSTIPDYVFSLIDVYRKGKERVAQFSTSIPRSQTDVASNPFEKQYTSLPTSNVFTSFTFLSGKVRMYGGRASDMARSRQQDLADEELLDMGTEIFNLPVVSVWVEYRATPASRKVNNASDSEPSTLMFKSAVHSSQNTLRPSLLPFLTEIVSHVEKRLRTVSHVSQPPIPTAITGPTSPGTPSPTPDSSMQISFSLRIDQSKLELTCQPDVNVIAGVHWDSGGFVVNISPGARNVTFTGSVGGLTIGLKHGFLSDDCVKLDARNLAFSVTFSKVVVDPSKSISSLSVVLDTEFLGGVRFSRLQDILCFKAVWLDRIPVFNAQNTQLTKSSQKSDSQLTLQPGPAQQEFTTLILVQIRHIGLDVDLGQSISNVSLDLRDSVIRTKLNEVASELSVSVGDVIIVGKGNLAGRVEVSKCVFQTTRLMQASAGNRMLELRMTSGVLTAILDSDHQRMLHYRADPLEVEIYDDWSLVSETHEKSDRPIQMAFTVNSPEIVALATISTIPKLILYVNKFKVNMEHQKQGAIRESATFRATQAPKPDNPLSAVAEAMLQSARTRLKEAESGLSYIIRQQMTLRLGLLRLLVFPRNMAESEVAQFIGRNVRGCLDRVVESGHAPMKRDIRLSFSSMLISRFNQLGRSLSLRPELENGKEWLETLLKDASEANIVGLPSMMMHMQSDEAVDEGRRVLMYDFYSRFLRDADATSEEDIYITLNVNLYAWLTLLRKTLTREMDQAKLAADPKHAPAHPTTALRRRAPEPLAIPDSPALASPSERHAIKSATSVGRMTPSATPLLPFPTPEFTPATTSNMPMSPTIPDTAEEAGVGFPSIGTPESVAREPDLELVYRPRHREIQRLTMRQLGEATPDVMHPFFMKKAGFNLEDSLPQYVNEFAVAPLEEIMEVLLKLYSKQLLAGTGTS